MSPTRGQVEDWQGAMRVAWDDLKLNAAALQECEPRCRDVLWPLFHYENIDIEFFDSSTMCLLARDEDRTLYLNERIVSDIYSQAGRPATAVNWFWTHQMVHVTQGLSFKSFRELNTEPDRLETTRADIWADFISIKTLAVLDVLKTGARGQDTTTAVRDRELTLFREVVWPMINMRPNYFIPFERDFEAKRVLSLLVLGVLFESIATSGGSEMIDDSVFVNWRAGKTALYVWYGQTGLLCRRSIPCEGNEIDMIVSAIKEGRYGEAQHLVQALPLPTATELQEYCGQLGP